MAKQTVNIGSTANDGTGDQLRNAFDKLNQNNDEIYGDNFVTEAMLNDNIVGADELKVTGDGSVGQILTSNADGTFSWTTGVAGDITGVEAGDGLTGGGTGGDVTLNVVAGTGITVAADSVSLAASVQSEITANTAKDAFPGFGTVAGTSLEGDTALLQVGTLATEALAGNTTTITPAQAGEIAANTAKEANVTHTGDVTDASGVLTIADNVVNATKLDVTGDGTAGQLLQSDGDGSMTWVTGVTGDITSIIATDGITTPDGTAGDVTISLAAGVAGDGLTLTSGVLDVSVATSQIADNAVTSPKLAEFDDTFTAGTSGDIIVSNGTDFIHATMSGDATIVSGGAITIANDAVTTDKILNDAVTADKLADSINTDIAAGVAKVSNVTHTGEVTGSGALTITDGAVVADRLATDAVTTDKILDNAVDYDKLGTEFTTSTSFTAATDFDVDWSTAAIFTAPSSIPMDLRFTNAEVGQVKTIIVTASGGASSLTFDNSMTITTLNGSYSATAGAVNYIQAVCTATDTFFLTISQAA
jgi:hypothetical protein